jgi:hypothetical protein
MKIKLFAHGGLVNTGREDSFEFPDEDWNSMTEEEREEFLTETGWEFAQTCGIEFGAYIDEEKP